MAALRFLQTDLGRKILMEKKPWLKAQDYEVKKAMGAKISLINKWKREHPGENYKDHLDEVYACFYKEIKGRTVEKYKNDRIKRLLPFGWKLYFFDETQVNNEFLLERLGGDLN